MKISSFSVETKTEKKQVNHGCQSWFYPYCNCDLIEYICTLS